MRVSFVVLSLSLALISVPARAAIPLGDDAANAMIELLEWYGSQWQPIHNHGNRLSAKDVSCEKGFRSTTSIPKDFSRCHFTDTANGKIISISGRDADLLYGFLARAGFREIKNDESTSINAVEISCRALHSPMGSQLSCTLE